MSESTGVTHRISQSRYSEVTQLVDLFTDEWSSLGSFTPVGECDLPPSYAALLAHHDHMTVTLEEYHKALVRVEVVEERANESWYARQSLLARISDDAIVQYGIMRIDVSGLPTNVRLAIETHAAPLGRILIENDLLRHVELLALWRIEVGPRLAEPLALSVGDVVYGRSAVIHLSGKRAVDLLEIVTDHPVPRDA